MACHRLTNLIPLCRCWSRFKYICAADHSGQIAIRKYIIRLCCWIVFLVAAESKEREQPPRWPTTQPPPLDDYDYEEIDYTGGSARRAILSIKFGTARAHLSFTTHSDLSCLDRRRQGRQDGSQTRRRPPLRPVRIFQSPGAL